MPLTPTVATFRSIVSTTGKVGYDELIQLVAQTSPATFKELVGYPFLIGCDVKGGDIVAKPNQPRSFRRRVTMLFKPSAFLEQAREVESIQKIVYTLASSDAASPGGFREHTVGSSAENTITLPDFAVSTRHARISYINGSYILFDTESTNGTFVNGVSVPQAGRKLESGDFIRFGRYEFLFADPETLHQRLLSRLATQRGERA